jgi:hypothetical protein
LFLIDRFCRSISSPSSSSSSSSSSVSFCSREVPAYDKYDGVYSFTVAKEKSVE